MKDYIFLAVKNLKKRGIRSWLTMLGIFIGIAAVVSLISLSQGLESAIIGQFSSLDPDKLIVQSASTGFGPPGSTAVTPLTDHDIQIIESVGGVDKVIPRYIRTVSVEYNDIRTFGTAATIPKTKESVAIVYDALNAKVSLGRLLDENDRDRVVLGNDFLETDDFGKPIRIGSKLLIQGKEFEVAGFLEKSSTFLINSAILMPEDDLKDILNIDDEIDLIVVQVEDSDNLEKIAESISRELRQDRDQKLGEEDFAVQTPLQSLGAINTILTIINLIVVGIASISLLIGGIGIANTMFTSVLERRKEIGIMKSIGAQNKNILTIFIVESGLLGLVGGIIGVIIGLGLAFLVSSAAGAALGGINLQVTLSLPLILGSILFSLVLGLIFGIVPAWQAAKLNPVEALRK